MIKSKWGSSYKVILSPNDRMIRVVRGGTEVGGSRVVRVVRDGTEGESSSPSSPRWTEVVQGQGWTLVDFWDMTHLSTTVLSSQKTP